MQQRGGHCQIHKHCMGTEQMRSCRDTGKALDQNSSFTPLKGTSHREHRPSSPRAGDAPFSTSPSVAKITSSIPRCAPAQLKAWGLGKGRLHIGSRRLGEGVTTLFQVHAVRLEPWSQVPGTRGCFLLHRDLEGLQGHWLLVLEGSLPGSFPSTSPFLCTLHSLPATPAPRKSEQSTHTLRLPFLPLPLRGWTS